MKNTKQINEIEILDFIMLDYLDKNLSIKKLSKKYKVSEKHLYLFLKSRLNTLPNYEN